MYLKKGDLFITKDALINTILDKIKEGYISTDDLFILINEATDEDGIISKKKLFSSIKSRHTKFVIKDICNLLEDTIFDFLASANERQNVCIRLFDGVSLEGIYFPEKMKKNNLTGEIALVKSKIKPKFNITRYYCEKLNNK